MPPLPGDEAPPEPLAASEPPEGDAPPPVPLCFLRSLPNTIVRTLCVRFTKASFVPALASGGSRLGEGSGEPFAGDVSEAPERGLDRCGADTAPSSTRTDNAVGPVGEAPGDLEGDPPVPWKPSALCMAWMRPHRPHL